MLQRRGCPFEGRRAKTTKARTVAGLLGRLLLWVSSRTLLARLKGPLVSRRRVSASAVIVRGGEDGGCGRIEICRRVRFVIAWPGSWRRWRRRWRCGGSGRTRFCMCAAWSSMVGARACSRRCFGLSRRRPGTSRCSSFWPTRRGSRSCLCVAARSGWRRRSACSAWIVDDTGIAKDGRHSPGVKRQYSGTLGKIGNCQITVSVHAVGERGTLPLGWRSICPRSGATTARGGARRRSRTRSCFQTKPQLAGELARAGGRLGDADGADPGRLGLRRRQRLPRPAARAGARVRRSRCAPRRASTGRRRASRCRSATARSAGGRAGRARPTASRSRCARSPSGCPPSAWKTLPCRTTPAGEEVDEPLRLRPRRRHPPRPHATASRRGRSG